MNSLAGIDPEPLAGLEPDAIQQTVTPFGTGAGAPHATAENLTGGLIPHNYFQSHSYNTLSPEKFLWRATGKNFPL